MSGPFSCSTSSGTRKSFGEIDRLSFLFIDVHVPELTPRIHYSEASLQFAETTTFVCLCRVNTGIVREQTKTSFEAPWGHHLYIDSTIFGQGRNHWGTPAAIFLGVENSPSTKTLNFLSVRKEAVSLVGLV
jgi:hypothetical protein